MNCFVRVRHYYLDAVPQGVYSSFEEATAIEDVEPSASILDAYDVDPTGKEYMDVVTEFRDGQPRQIWSRASAGYVRPEYQFYMDQYHEHHAGQLEVEPVTDASALETMRRSWEAMSEAADPSCEYCHGTGWAEFDHMVGRCECLPEEMQASLVMHDGVLAPPVGANG